MKLQDYYYLPTRILHQFSVIEVSNKPVCCTIKIVKKKKKKFQSGSTNSVEDREIRKNPCRILPIMDADETWREEVAKKLQWKAKNIGKRKKE